MADEKIKLVDKKRLNGRVQHLTWFQTRLRHELWHEAGTIGWNVAQQWVIPIGFQQKLKSRAGLTVMRLHPWSCNGTAIPWKNRILHMLVHPAPPALLSSSHVRPSKSMRTTKLVGKFSWMSWAICWTSIANYQSEMVEILHYSFLFFFGYFGRWHHYSFY